MQEEQSILNNCALRFDGYKYLAHHPFDYEDALEQYKRTGAWSHLDEHQKLAAFFFLQRYLAKWGGEYLSLRSLTWRGFRELFLEVWHVKTPPDFRLEDWAQAWDERTAQEQEAAAAIVRAVHESTDYADTDVLNEYL